MSRLSNLFNVTIDATATLVEKGSSVAVHTLSAAENVAKTLDTTTEVAYLSNAAWAGETISNMTDETRAYISARDSSIVMPERPALTKKK